MLKNNLFSSATCICYKPYEKYLYHEPKALRTVNGVFRDYCTHYMFLRKFLEDPHEEAHTGFLRAPAGKTTSAIGAIASEA